MMFLTTLIAVILVYYLGVGNRWRREQWFGRWFEACQQKTAFASPVVCWGLLVLLPGLVVALLIRGVEHQASPFWLFVVQLPVLLFCLGPDPRPGISHYLELFSRGDNVAASLWVDQMRGGASLEPVIDVRDWQALHLEALEIIAYRTFERLFAVLFWFFVGGAALALVYRLSVLTAERTPAGQWPRRWLWLIEWPVVRLLGLSWALAGNFDTCAANLKRDCFTARSGSAVVLVRSLRGALGSSDSDPVPDTGETLIHSALALNTRALWLWLCALALATLVVV